MKRDWPYRRFNLRFFDLHLPIILSFTLLSGCFLFFSPKGPVPIKYTQDTLALAWDDDQAAIQDIPSAVEHYNVFYRPIKTASWIFLQSTPDSSAHATVMRIGDGSYEFAVQSVTIDGRRSDLHRSSDFSAWPSGGWYILWE